MILRIEHCWVGERERWELVRYELGRRILVGVAYSEREALFKLWMQAAVLPVVRRVCR